MLRFGSTIALVVTIIAAAAASLVGSQTSPAGTVNPHWVITDLGTLGPAFTSCTGADINELGEVAGGCGTASGNGRAFLWRSGGMCCRPWTMQESCPKPGQGGIR